MQYDINNQPTTLGINDTVVFTVDGKDYHYRVHKGHLELDHTASGLNGVDPSGHSNDFIFKMLDMDKVKVVKNAFLTHWVMNARDYQIRTEGVSWPVVEHPSRLVTQKILATQVRMIFDRIAEIRRKAAFTRAFEKATGKEDITFNIKAEYCTPDGRRFETHAEAERHITSTDFQKAMNDRAIAADTEMMVEWFKSNSPRGVIHLSQAVRLLCTHWKVTKREGV